MGASAHRIGRVVFDIEAPDDAAASAFGDAVRARFDAVIAPALEAALDSIDRPGALVRLGRIEIDLGVLRGPPADITGLTRHLAEGIASALERSVAHQTAPEPTRDDAAELIAFLETGEMPWPGPGGALAALADALLALAAPEISRLANRLRTVLIRRRAAERLARQLPAALVRRLLRALLPNDVAAALTMFGPDVPARADAPPPEALVPRLAALFHSLAAGSPTPELGEAVALYASLDNRVSPDLPAGFAPVQAAKFRAAYEPDTRETESSAVPPQQATGDEPVEPSPTGMPRPVHAAGAVLLHPFLSTLFDRVGLLAGPGRFRDAAAQARAVLLVHHLATGAEDAPEPETILFKLLCGMAIAEPVPHRIALTEAERTEAAALLDGVIAHWGRLGKTTPAGLRDGFLSRMGTLRRNGGGWTLSVERKGIDILLDDLPWTLSRVKTPFMRQLMAVDWR
ncbi:MAG: contractile injection system tape measure protein [Sphingomonadales bacterium]